VVELIYQSYVDGLSLRKIQKLLREGHYVAPGNGWYTSLIRHILLNPVYAGIVYYGTRRHEVIDGKRTRRDCEPLAYKRGRHTPIISHEMWGQVQGMMAKKVAMGGRAAGSPRPFSGFLRCARCGYSMVTINGKYQNYQCSTYRRHNGAECSLKTQIAYKQLREAFFLWRKSLVVSPETYEAWRSGADNADHEARLSALQTALTDNRRASAALTRMLGKIPESDWVERYNQLEEEKADIERRIIAQSDLGVRRAMLPTYDEWCQMLEQDSDDSIRQALMRSIHQILWDGEKLTFIPI